MHRHSSPGDDHAESVIPFPSRIVGEPDRPPRRNTNRPRRARRRRENTPWLQRNALSIAAVSILVALLGIGFGLAELIARPEPAPALLAVPSTDQAAPTATVANSAIANTNEPAIISSAPAPDPARPIQGSVTTIQPNYTVQAGDTLAKIAAQFNTTVERIQALNKLSDPRALRIGTKLVIPPSF